MINPFDYLHYKIYKAWSQLNGGGYPFSHYAVIAIPYILNSLTIYILIVNEFPSKEIFSGIAFPILVIVFICYRPNREDKILAKYCNESEDSRLIGNAVVVFYYIISILVFILVRKYR